MLLSLTTADNSDPPVGQRHAVEEAGECWVDAQAPGAQWTEPVRLTPGPVLRVEVQPHGAAAALPPAGSRVTVRGRHHEVSAVDHLEGAGGGGGGRSDTV